MTLERVTRSRDTAEARVLELESSLRGAERLVASLQAGASAESIKCVGWRCESSLPSSCGM